MDRATEMLPRVQERLGAIADEINVTITGSAADVTAAAAAALDEGCDALYVAGGDGTLNAALRGIAHRDEARSLAIGIIPFGTGNDFAKALALGEDPDAALQVLLDPHVIQVDIGLLNDRPFVNTSAGGFIASVSEAVTPALKDIAGKVAYLIGGARALLTASSTRMRLVVSDDTAALPTRASSAAATPSLRRRSSTTGCWMC
jgi:diacylglycerol kinase (ATP)